jgi:hypothetical protein
MSVLRQTQPIRPIAPRRHLRPVTSRVQPVTRRATSTRPSASTFRSALPAHILKKLIIGFAAVGILSLIANALCDTAVYRISSLKIETATLATQTQIIGQQVDSLRSPQNLSNSAKSLGMIVNSNPVFLNVREAKVLGSAIPASVSASSGVSTNLIANAAMTVKSDMINFGKKTVSRIDAPVTKPNLASSVKSTNIDRTKVALTPVGIPATPTN